MTGHGEKRVKAENREQEIQAHKKCCVGYRPCALRALL